MMKTIGKFLRLSMLMLVVLTTIGNLDAAPKNADNDKTIKILAIGNSFSQDAIEQYFWELAEAEGIRVVVGNLYFGGCSLEGHLSFLKEGKSVYEYRKIKRGIKVNTPKVNLDKALTDEKWDYISFQQASHFSGLKDTYMPYMKELMEYVREKVGPDVKFLFHSTWAYSEDSNHSGFKNYDNSQMKMYNDIIAATRNAMKIGDFYKVIPSGTAIQNGRTSELGDTFCRDGYHLNLIYGRYTAACTWFETIFGLSVVGNPYSPRGISERQRIVAQQAAHAAVANPYEITPIE